MQTRISLTKIEFLKKELSTLLAHVKSSHRVEAMARGLGWSTNAALRAELAVGPLVRTVAEGPFSGYLADHGFSGLRNGVLTEAVGRVDFSVARQAILAVMEREPHLSPNGYPNSYTRMTPAERKAEFDRQRASMVSDYHIAQFLMAQEFLLTVPRTKRVMRKVSSYGYKHQVGEFQKRKNAPDHYVSNGMFIVAALDMGFVVTRIEGSPNAYLNIGTPKPERSPGRSAILATAANGPTWEAWRNVMVAAVNAGIEQGHFSLEPDDNRFDGEGYVYRFDLDGIPAIAYVKAMAEGKLMFHAALHPTRHADQAIRVGMSGFAAGEAFSQGMMERLDRRFLTSTRPYTSFRLPLLDKVVGLKVEPKGFTTMPSLQV